MKKANYPWIDLLKGLGIVLVILGHSSAPSIINKVIYSFHMPLFFVISGFLFSEERFAPMNYWSFVKVKAKRLLLPYAIYGMANLIFEVILHAYIFDWENTKVFALTKIIGLLWSRGTLIWMPNCSPLWFLTCMFCCQCIFFAVYRLGERWLFAIPAISCIGFLLGNIKFGKLEILPWNISQAMACSLFFLIGLLFRRNENIMESLISHKGNVILLVIFIVVGIYASIHNESVDYGGAVYGNIVLTIISGTLISVALLLCVYGLRQTRLRLSILSILGTYSVHVMGLDYFLLYRGGKILEECYFFNDWPTRFLYRIVTFLLLFILVKKIKVLKGDYR